MHESKSESRKRILAIRRGLTADEVRERGRLVMERMQRTLDARFPRGVKEALLYMPHANEVNILPLLDLLWRRGSRVLLPRCDADRPGHMHLACATCHEQLAPGAFGIIEPKKDVCAPVDTYAPELAVIPGVAYDRRGQRIGYGGGYYDRLLAAPAMRGALILAPVYDFQLLTEIQADPWDRPVNLIIAETETIEVCP